ncbi:MAG: menaquinone-specific isochorismate synthase [Pseudomonadota bacterium]|nr:menaquinone-specific isochorismate synthase [Pseudomonadota bacterium]
MKNVLDLSTQQRDELSRRLAQLAEGAPSGALLSITLDLGPGNADWLDRQARSAEICYRASPDRGEYWLGIGRAVVCASAGPARFTALQAAHAGIAQHWRHDDGEDGNSGFEPVACLGFAFDEESTGELPNAQLGVAAILLSTSAGHQRATFTTPARDRGSALARWQTLLQAHHTPAGTWATGKQPDATLARRAWEARVAAALAAIRTGEIDKVVLSRSLRIAIPQAYSPFSLLRRLLRQHPESTTFAFGNAQGVFLGATPERLVGLSAGQVRADALAGTAWAGQPLAIDKNTHEQQLVVDAIRQALAPLCSSLQLPPEPQVLQLRHLQHLWTPVSGEVHAGVGLFDLIARLHPTPAVGGWPAAAACEWLRRHGEQRPGWYGGGIGWINRHGDGEVSVALRCGLMTAGSLTLSAGAGIVAGSQPAHEFGETEAKLATMLGALNATPAFSETAALLAKNG